MSILKFFSDVEIAIAVQIHSQVPYKTITVSCNWKLAVFECFKFLIDFRNFMIAMQTFVNDPSKPFHVLCCEA